MRILSFIVTLFCSFAYFSLAQANQAPNWVYNPQQSCSGAEFCGVGFGQSQELADARARGEIAKIFEAKIKSDFSSFEASNNDSLQTSASENLSENVEKTIKNTQIKFRHSDNNTYYSFAVLDKEKSAQIIKSQIYELDEQIRVLLADPRPTSARKAEQLYKKRASLNQEHMILANSEIMPLTSFEDVFNNKKNKIGQDTITLIMPSPKDAFLEKSIKNAFEQNGVIFAQNGQNLFVETQIQELPFAIKNMVKIEYIISMSIEEKTGEKTEIMNQSFVGVGLSQDQAKQDAAKLAKEYIIKNKQDFNF